MSDPVIPVTFSAPGSAFLPAVEDALRYAGWLLHFADNLMRGRYAEDATDLTAGINIVQTWANARREDGRIAIRQCIISHSFDDSGFAYLTSKQGTKRVIIGAEHIFPYDTAYGSDDIESDEVTANSVAERSEQLFFRGTLYQPGMGDNRGMLIDPYNSPLFTEEDAPSEDQIGAYDPDRARYLNDAPPTLQRRTYELPVDPRLTAKDLERDPQRSSVVIYGVFATYEIRITDLPLMRSGGILG